MNSKVSKFLAIIALGVGGGSIYLIPYIRYVFYDWQVAAMGITDTQLGTLSSAYAIGCMLLYIPGGLLADKLSTKKCIMASLLSTTVLTVILAFVNGYVPAMIIWFLFALSTTFVFWGSLMKTIRMIGTEKEQGFMFGLYYMGNGITGAIINAVALSLASNGDGESGKFFICVLTYAGGTLLAAILVFIFVKETLYVQKDITINEFKINQVKGLLMNPTVWIFTFIIFAAYTVGYSGGTMFTPYLTDVVGITPEESGAFSIIRSYVFYLLAPLSGFVADKLFKSTSKWFIILFAILAALYFGVFAMPDTASTMAVSIYTLLPGLFGLSLYGIMFSIANETRIPVVVMGTAVGIASVIGYSPDFFMWTLFGSWTDKFGNDGYNYIFTYLGVISALGIVASFYILQRAKKAQKLEADTK
ncbi:MAG: MFS transporter [Anaerovoracaceae bacterium]